MEEIAGWIAPAATMIAAMMTAANLGARFTGWGFVVFLVGSLAWTVVAIFSGQQNLLLTNSFLALVNLVGIWRWLGRQAKYADGAEAASLASDDSAAPALFAINGLEGRDVTGSDGSTIAQIAGAMAESASGRIAYLVLREGGVGGVGERLHALAWQRFTMDEAAVRVDCDAAALAALPAIAPDCWPERAPNG